MMPAMMRPWRSTMDLPNCAMRAKRTTSDMRELIWLSKTCFIRTCLRGLPPGGDDLLQKWYPPSLPVIQTAQRSGVEITVKTLEAKKKHTKTKHHKTITGPHNGFISEYMILYIILILSYTYHTPSLRKSFKMFQVRFCFKKS